MDADEDLYADLFVDSVEPERAPECPSSQAAADTQAEAPCCLDMAVTLPAPAAPSLPGTMAQAFLEHDLRELRVELESCKNMLADSDRRLAHSQDRCASLEAERSVLVRNISVLFRTATLELERRAGEIKQLRTDLEHSRRAAAVDRNRQPAAAAPPAGNRHASAHEKAPSQARGEGGASPASNRHASGPGQARADGRSYAQQGQEARHSRLGEERSGAGREGRSAGGSEGRRDGCHSLAGQDPERGKKREREAEALPLQSSSRSNQEHQAARDGSSSHDVKRSRVMHAHEGRDRQRPHEGGQQLKEVHGSGDVPLRHGDKGLDREGRRVGRCYRDENRCG